MEKFAHTVLTLDKHIKKGHKESLLSLFSVQDRFSRMEVLKTADESSPIKVVLEGLAEADLKLGADMVKGQQKTIMTLFWFEERSKLMEMQRDALKGESLILNLFLGPS